VSALSTIDTLAHTNRWSTRHLGERLWWSGGLLAAAVTLPVWPAAPLVLGAVAVSCRLAALPLGEVLRILRAPAGFVAAGVVVSTVSIQPGWPPTVGLGDPRAGLTLAGRAIAAGAAAVLFACTVPLPALLARARRWRVPASVCELAMLMYRMVAVGLERARWQRLAQESRGGYLGVRRSVRSIGALAAAAFVGSIGQAERLATGLAARNFDGTVHLLDDECRPSPTFVVGSSVALGVLVAVAVAVGGGWL
jgi:cobalt/nickel transport system permease protein